MASSVDFDQALDRTGEKVKKVRRAFFQKSEKVSV
jgi:hypothetical protein